MPILNIRAEARAADGEQRPSPEMLATDGPIVPVTLTLTEETSRAYVERGESLPEPVSGFAMIDTGATRTCLDEASARRAGFPITGIALMASATHANHEVPVFNGRIVMVGSFNIDVVGGLGANLTAIGDLDLVALIGRDLLKDALFTYNGPGGSIALAI